MKKILFIVFLLFYTLTFSKNIVFNFNVPIGKIQFSNEDTATVQSLSFYDGTATLDLDEKNYTFIFIAPEYPAIVKNIDIKNSSQIDIVFSKENSAIIHGKVISQDINIGAAQISFVNNENRSYNFVSNIYGEFTAYIPSGKYRIKVDRLGYMLDKKNAIIYEFSNLSSPYKLDINLIELPSIIQGKAVDENGNSIPYPQISIKNDLNIVHVIGDEFGMFRFPVSAGIVTILCQKDGYIQNGVVRKVEKNSSITNIEIPLKRTRYSISGTVTDGVKALKGIQVSLRDEDFNKIDTVYSNENGFFEFYKVLGNKNIFLTVTKNNKVLKKSEVITLDRDIKNFNLILEK